MFDFLKKILDGQNQFASGGLLLMILGSVGVFLRSLPSQLWHWIVRQTTMSITVKDDDQAFHWVKEWFLEQPFLKRVRRLDLDTSLRGAEAAMVPAPGSHWFLRDGRPYRVWFWRSEEAKGGYNPRRTESLMFETIGRDQTVLRKFVAEVVACHKAKLRTASYLYLYDDGWDRVEAYWPRRLDSVLLKPGEKEHLIQDLQRFRTARERYRTLGVPYHRGYLFYGPPGTGKTSLVSALAAHFGMSVYIVNLSEMNDRTLKTAMNWVSENSFILFEDIDCMNAHTRRSDAAATAKNQTDDEKAEKSAIDKMGVSLSGLLNVLDGFSAPENVVYAMTTNDISALDAALLRPGRIDYKLYLGEACESQKVELYRRFFPESSEEDARAFAQANWAETMAEFQGLLLALEQEVGTTEVVVAQ